MKNYFNSAKRSILIFFLAAIFVPFKTFSQCKRFVKEQIPRLSPFIYNGKKNSAILLPGDHSELSLTFYSGQTYRIILKAEETPGNVFFIIKDSNKNQLFTSNKLSKSDFYDFTSESTQQLTIEMIAPEPAYESKKEAEISACVCVIVGVKE